MPLSSDILYLYCCFVRFVNFSTCVFCSRVFSEGGNFCVEEIGEYKGQLDRVSGQIEQTEGVIMADLESMESSRMDKANQVCSNFENKSAHHYHYSPPPPPYLSITCDFCSEIILCTETCRYEKMNTFELFFVHTNCDINKFVLIYFVFYEKAWSENLGFSLLHGPKMMILLLF